MPTLPARLGVGSRVSGHQPAREAIESGVAM